MASKTSPANCALLLGVHLGPTSHDLASAQQKDCVRQVLLDGRQMGASVPSLEPVCIQTISAAARRFDVLIFFTHHTPKDGFQVGSTIVSAESLGSAIGATYSGTIDVGVCNTRDGSAGAWADTTLDRLRKACPLARCVGYDGEHRVDIHASVVRATLRTLLHTPRPYVEALVDVLEEFERQARVYQ